MVNRRRVVLAWLTVVAVVAVLAGLAAPAARAASPGSSTYTQRGTGLVSLTPARVLDTRAGTGAPKRVPAAKSTTKLTVLGHGGVPATGVEAVVLNVTAVSPVAAGYVTAWPAGVTRPTASNLNYVKGQIVANQVIVKVGTAGVVDLFTLASAGLVADVTGYYPTSAKFNALVPSRLLDTRTGSQPTAGSTTPMAVIGRAGVPASGVAAVVLNVTAVNAADPGFVTVYPAGQSRPTASNLNYVAGEVVPAMVIATVGTGGVVDLYTLKAADLVVDVAGWIPATSDYTALTPSRVLDTRSGLGATKARVPANGSVTVQVTGTAGVPVDGVNAVEVNVTAVNPSGPGFVTTYPAGVARPTASTVNYTKDQIVANSATVKIGSGGKITFYSLANADLVVDVAGYFATPTATTLTYDPASTVVVPDAKTSAVTPPTTAGGTGTYTSTGSTPATVGQYVYLPPGGTNGNGLVGQVTAVNGSTTTVTNVPMQQAFTSGNITGTSSAVAAAAPTTGAAGDIRRAKSSGPATPALTASCSLGAGMPIDVTLGTPRFSVKVSSSWGPLQPAKFKATVTTSMPVDVTASVDAALSCSLSQKLFPKLRLPAIGPFEPEISAVGDIDITGQVAATTAHLQASLTTGVQWTQGQPVTPIVKPGIKLTGVDWPSGSGSSVQATIEAGPEVSFLFAGVVGPSISAMLYLQENLNGTKLPFADLEVGIKIGAALTLDVLFVKVDVSLASVTVWHTTLADSGTAPNNPPAAPLTITTSLPDGTVGQPYNATLTATGGTPPYVWTATGLPAGLSANSSTGVISGTPTASGTNAVTITAGDRASQTTRDVLSLTVNGASPSAPLTWGAPTYIDPAGYALWSVSCPTDTFCAAVDLHEDALTFDGIGWSTPQYVNSIGYGLSSVSCPTRMFCAAVDEDGDAVTFNGIGWSAPQWIDPNPKDYGLNSVSCPSSVFCAAVDSGGNVVALNGTGSWPPQSIDPSGGGLTSVSCPSSAFCVAVDTNGNALTYNGISWATPQSIDPDGGGLASVSCPSSAFCVAVDKGGNALTFDGISWSPRQYIDSTGYRVFSVSCPSSAFCVAVDNGGNALTFDGISWATPRSIDPNGGGLTAVSCPSRSFCAAVDAYGDVVMART